MNHFTRIVFLVAVLFPVIGGCSKPTSQSSELAYFPLDGLEGILTSSPNVKFDRKHSFDGNGSVRIDTWETVTVRLFEVTDIDVENARLIYRAKVKTQGVLEKAYLEMWCQFEGRGEYFSRDLETPMTGTTDWSTEETMFLLEEGQNPDLVKLNVVIEGSGRVWIDDVRLIRGPL